MTSNIININGYTFESLLHLNIHKEVWCHPTLSLEGHIHEDEKEKISGHLVSGKNVTLTARDNMGNNKIIFCGLIKDILIKTRNNMSVLVLDAIGYSALLDVQEHSRTFQDSGMTYKQVTEYLKEGYSECNYILPKHCSTSIGEMIVQYRETDFEFCKRIASRLETVLVTAANLDSPFISIGIPQNQNNYTVDSDEYETRRDTNAFLNLKKNNKDNKKYYLTESDTLSYSFKDRAFYDLCDNINFNSENLLVYKLDIDLVGSELIGNYTLKPKSAFTSREYRNEKIIGASWSGTVKEVKDEEVKVTLFDDIEQTRDRWFLYSTPYSSPDGTGWYFMPEIGDEIRLQFPTEIEHEAYAISSTHITHGDRSDPKIKFIRTIRGQSITFHPDAIHIDDGCGSEILLEKDTGITINTNKGISMTAQENISISSQSKVIVQGDEKVSIKQNDSLIKLEDTIDITASHVRIQ